MDEWSPCMSFSCHTCWAEASLGMPVYATHHLHLLFRPEMQTVQFWRSLKQLSATSAHSFLNYQTINVSEIESISQTAASNHCPDGFQKTSCSSEWKTPQ